MGSTIDWIKQAATQRTNAADQLGKRIEKLREAASSGEIPTDEADAKIAELSRKEGEQRREAQNLKEFVTRYGT